MGGGKERRGEKKLIVPLSFPQCGCSALRGWVEPAFGCPSLCLFFFFSQNTAEVGAGEVNDKAVPVIPTEESSVERRKYFSLAAGQSR